jgi:hydroxymethylglutaryl-CoA synthase
MQDARSRILLESSASAELFDGVPAGAYTVGLGQAEMACCDEREDIVSMMLTVVSRLLENHGVHASRIGRLEVGTETPMDSSKLVKTTLMRLFTDAGNHDVEGADCRSSCYGGTAALFNSVAWVCCFRTLAHHTLRVCTHLCRSTAPHSLLRGCLCARAHKHAGASQVESSSWDGRLALVVAGDIAMHDGPARPTGGAGVVAMLIGPDAPLILEPGMRASHMEDGSESCDRDHASEYAAPILLPARPAARKLLHR